MLSGLYLQKFFTECCTGQLLYMEKFTGTDCHTNIRIQPLYQGNYSSGYRYVPLGLEVFSLEYNKYAATRENQSSGFPIRSATNLPVKSQKRATSLKFRIEEEKELYYPSSENKGADQLCSYCTADLRLCFRIGKNLGVFS